MVYGTVAVGFWLKKKEDGSWVSALSNVGRTSTRSETEVKTPLRAMKNLHSATDNHELQ